MLHLSQSLEGVVRERAELVVGEVEEVEPAQLGEAAPLHHRDLVLAQLEVREGGVGAEDALHRADPDVTDEVSFFMTMAADADVTKSLGNQSSPNVFARH